MPSDVFIAGACRTPVGAFCGGLSSVPAPDLGASCIAESLRRAGVEPESVDEAIVGNVIGAGLGQNVGRQCLVKAGLPQRVAGMTVNKVCGSGLKAVMLAAQAIQCGDSGVVVAGGTENMSAAPYLLPKARTGYRMGDGELIDAMVRDGLWDVYGDTHMGNYGDATAAKYGLTRKDQDDFAVTSYERALQSRDNGAFAAEIVPVEVPGKRGAVTVVDTDEGLARFDEEKMRGLRPAFSSQGTVTAGNASSINDGAAACVVLSKERVETLGVQPQARVLGYSQFACEPQWFTLAPVGAITDLLEKTGLDARDVDLFEINEAFSAVVLAAMKDHRLPHEKVNVLGGAVALGHPIGATGSRTLVTLLNALKRTGGRVGIDAVCIGGGEAVAMAVELV